MANRGVVWSSRIPPGLVPTALSLALSLLACGRSARDEAVGSVDIALNVVPSDVACLQITARGARTVSRAFEVAPATSPVLSLSGLSIGVVELMGTAISVRCAELDASIIPTWVSDPVATVISPGVTAQVALVMHRNGRASVGVTFDEGDLGGASGSAGHIDGGTGGGGDAGGASPDGPFDSGVPDTRPDVSGGTGGTAAPPDASADEVDPGPTCGGGIPDSNAVWDSQPFAATPPLAMAVLGPNDAWAVRRFHAVDHWDGTTWTDVLPDDGNSGSLRTLWAASSDDVWAAGDDVWHWDGVQWSAREIPGTIINRKPILNVHPFVAGWSSGKDDVWVAGMRGANPERIGPMFHWDGAAWANVDLSSLIPPGDWSDVRSFWGTGPGDVWAFGVHDESSVLHGLALHWDGQRWTKLDVTGAGISGLSLFSAASGRAARDIWVAGTDAVGGVLWHFDGTSFHKVAVTSNDVGQSIWASCTGEVWVSVGSRNLEVSLWRYRDGVSTFLELPGLAATVAGESSGDVWVGGVLRDLTQGVLFRRRSSTDSSAICGDIRVEVGESCDPPNGRTCDSNCQRIPTCGDHVVDPGREQCDPPAPYECSPTCQLIPPCGNGRLDPGEQCDPPRDPYCGASCHFLPDGCASTGASCASTAECCNGTACGGGSCVACGYAGNPCDDLRPCCKGETCTTGTCLLDSPACMPDGGMCDGAHPCCSGVACVDGLCGEACRRVDSACDDAHPCCVHDPGSSLESGLCVNGVCRTKSGCKPEWTTCADSSCCGGICNLLRNGLCHQPGCAPVGFGCDTFPNGCCNGYTCRNRFCAEVSGCLLTGADCRLSGQCCSGVCGGFRCL